MSSAKIGPSKAISEYLSQCFDRLLITETEMVAGSSTAAAWNVVRLIAKRASERNWSTFLIGGAVRDLVLSEGTRTPRDVDLVVCEASQDELAAEFNDLSPARRTSFGGLRYNYDHVPIDIWSLEDTFALRHKKNISIRDVPKHAFLDVEAIAIEISPGSGKTRQIVENGFTRAVLSRTLDVNHAANPYPEICVVKALRTAISLNLSIGARLVEYILNRKWDLNALIEAQKSHYGDIVLDKTELEDILGILAKWDQKESKLDISSMMLRLKGLPVVVSTVNKQSMLPVSPKARN
jgi:hypothetical protein